MARAVYVATGTADAQGYTGSGTLMGVAVRETIGTNAAAVQVRDGTSTAGSVIAMASVAAAGIGYLPVPAVYFTTGLFVDRSLTGSSELVLYLL